MQNMNVEQSTINQTAQNEQEKRHLFYLMLVTKEKRS